VRCWGCCTRSLLANQLATRHVPAIAAARVWPAVSADHSFYALSAIVH